MLRSLYADLNVAIRLARPIDWETDDPLTATAAVDKEAESLLVRTPYQPIYEGATAAPPTAPQQARPRRNAGQAVGRGGRGQGHQRGAGTAVATAEATVTVAATARRCVQAARERRPPARLPPTLRELFDMVWKAQYAEMPDSLSASARAEQATALVLIKLQNQMDAHRRRADATSASSPF
eukprot:tig00021572_g22421.t1